MFSQHYNTNLSLEKTPVNWRNIRLIVHLLVFLILFVPYNLPLPFAPRFLHNIFGAGTGATVALVTVLFYVGFIFLLAIFLIESIYRRRLNESLLLEVICVPILLIAFAILFGVFGGNNIEKIAALNAGRSPSEFQNPYLSYKMLDCRNITDQYDVIFVPQHLGVEIDFLSYAPRRQNKTSYSNSGAKYGDDWYLEQSGSMWGDSLRECYLQNKSPN